MDEEVKEPYKAYIREVKGAKTAVLFIHGILGTPRHFDKMIEYVPKEWSIYNILLDGHGRSVKALAKSSMRKWEHQVYNIMKNLVKNYESVVVVGYSLGAMLAIDLGVTWPESVKFMFLQNLPLTIWVKWKVVKSAVKVGLGLVKDDDVLAKQQQASLGMEADNNPFHYIGWVPFYFQMQRKSHELRDTLRYLKIPTYAFYSGKDELVSKRTIKYLKRASGVSGRVMWNSGHYAYDPEDEKKMYKEFVEIYKKLGL